MGRTILVDREPHVIAGVAARGFAFPHRRTDAWLPMAFAANDPLDTRGNYFLQIVGRLRAGVTVAQGEAELQAIAQQVAAGRLHVQMTSVRVVPLHEQLVGEAREVLLLLFGAIGLVLGIACVNVANLLLARGTGRGREIAIRAGLGAGRGRIVRQLVTESTLLAFLGGAAGVAVAVGGIEVLTRLGPTDLPRLDEIRLDARTLGFTALLSAVTVLLFGVVPALQLSRIGGSASRARRGALTATGAEALDRMLRERAPSSGGPRRGRVQRMFIATQVALAVVLVVGAGLLVRSFVRVTQADPGYRVGNLLTVSLTLPEPTYP